MRKQIKQRIITLAATLEDAGLFIVNSLERNGAFEIASMLEDERQSAIRMAEIIAQSEGEEHPVVKSLQEYCLLLHQCLMATEGRERNALAQVLLEEWRKIQELFKNQLPVCYEAVFLPYKASMWDSLESVWLAAKEDNDWDCYVVPIPYYDRNSDHSLGTLHYENELYPEYVPVTSFRNYNLEVRHPDVIFIHNPYDEANNVTSVHPLFYSSRIKKYTDLLVYIPYFISENVQDWHCLVPGVAHSDLVIVQSEEARKTYIDVLSKAMAWDEKTAKYYGLYDKFRALGSPKIDKVLNTKSEHVVLPEEWREKIYKS